MSEINRAPATSGPAHAAPERAAGLGLLACLLALVLVLSGVLWLTGTASAEPSGRACEVASDSGLLNGTGLAKRCAPAPVPLPVYTVSVTAPLAMTFSREDGSFDANLTAQCDTNSDGSADLVAAYEAVTDPTGASYGDNLNTNPGTVTVNVFAAAGTFPPATRIATTLAVQCHDAADLHQAAA